MLLTLPRHCCHCFTPLHTPPLLSIFFAAIYAFGFMPRRLPMPLFVSLPLRHYDTPLPLIDVAACCRLGAADATPLRYADYYFDAASRSIAAVLILSRCLRLHGIYRCRYICLSYNAISSLLPMMLTRHARAAFADDGCRERYRRMSTDRRRATFCRATFRFIQYQRYDAAR